MAEKKISKTIVRSKITRKVISKASSRKAVKAAEPTEEVEEKQIRSKKTCQFCQSKTSPSYTDTAVLRRFMTDRAKIVPKLKSNLCSKHQRSVTKQIKYARHLALLPFTPRV